MSNRIGQVSFAVSMKSGRRITIGEHRNIDGISNVCHTGCGRIKGKQSQRDRRRDAAFRW